MRKWDIENRTKKDEEQAAKKDQNVEEGDEPLLPGETKTFAERIAKSMNRLNAS